MARYEKVTTKVTCPKCGNEGTATWEETSNPVYHGEHSRVRSVTGFTVTGGSAGKQEATCDRCGTKVSL
jgi:hypothetical protein